MADTNKKYLESVLKYHTEFTMNYLLKHRITW